MASDAAHGIMLGRLHERGFGEVRGAHFSLFQFPGPHGVRPGELAQRVGLTKQALNPLLNDLELWGYLRREVDPTDQRGRVLWLTARGLDLVATCKDVLTAIEAEIADRIGMDAFEQFRALLSSVEAGLQQAAHGNTADKSGRGAA